MLLETIQKNNIRIVTSPTVFNSIDAQIDDITKDFEQNITHIWGRADIMVAVDLVFHSVLGFNFQGDFIQRGYTELLVLGDSGQGKTALLQKLMQHYGLGEFISGETASRTGLVYTITETQNHRFLQWGIIPLGNGKLVAIDEFSGIPPEEVENMSSLRATGKAEVNRSIRAMTAARTRLIFLSNSRDGLQLAQYHNGVEAIDKLFNKKEDIRRLDLAVTVASGEVPTSEINKKHKPDVPHVYTNSACKNLILWCWSRRAGDVIIGEKTVETILFFANEISKKFHSQIPLVEPSDMRIKFARLSVALAGRLYSTFDDKHVVVLPEHVEWIYYFLLRIYTKASMGYDLYSRSRHSEDIIKDTRALKSDLAQYDLSFLRALFELRRITISEVEIITEDKDKAKYLVRKLRMYNAIKQMYTYNVPTKAFIIFLKDLIAEKEEEVNYAERQEEIARLQSKLNTAKVAVSHKEDPF